ncbi:hypothetical protein HZA57_06760 [Candidatus Poribacteria bacterium]|nr:hypothetical protein [Candidatus Poribacteria bacterium]
MARVLLLLTFLLGVGTGVVSCAMLAGGETVPPDAAKILIRYEWTERDAAAPPRGFLVHRAANATGPFECLTPEPLRLGRPEIGVSETLYVDRTARAGATYYYYLDALDASGRQVKWTNVTAAKAILPLEAEDFGPYRREMNRLREAGKTAKKPEPDRKRPKPEVAEKPPAPKEPKQP